MEDDGVCAFFFRWQHLSFLQILTSNQIKKIKPIDAAAIIERFFTPKIGSSGDINVSICDFSSVSLIKRLGVLSG